MLNEKRVKHMIKLASYEEKTGKEDLKIYSYSRKDYVNYSVLASLLWVTLAYIALVAIIFVMCMEMLMNKMNLSIIVLCASIVLIGYFITLIAFGWYANYYYNNKHSVARRNVKRFVKDLEILEKIYESEDV